MMLWKKMASITAMKLVPMVIPMAKDAAIRVVAAARTQTPFPGGFGAGKMPTPQAVAKYFCLEFPD